MINRHGDGPAGFVEEDDGDEKAERRTLEGFLNKAEGWRGQGGIWDAGYGTFRPLLRGFAREVRGRCWIFGVFP